MKTMYSPKKEDGRIARFPFRTMRGLIMFVCVCVPCNLIPLTTMIVIVNVHTDPLIFYDRRLTHSW